MKKLLFIFLMFVNIQFVYDEGLLYLCSSSKIIAQHMNKESGDNCYVEGYGYYDGGPYADCAPDSTSISCHYCGKYFSNEEELGHHENDCKSSPNNTYTCSYCGQKFNSNEDLTSHKNSCQSNPDNSSCYFCYRCGAKFYTSYSRDAHEKNCSTNPWDRKFGCSLCKQMFATEYELNTHRCRNRSR